MALGEPGAPQAGGRARGWLRAGLHILARRLQQARPSRAAATYPAASGLALPAEGGTADSAQVVADALLAAAFGTPVATPPSTPAPTAPPARPGAGSEPQVAPRTGALVCVYFCLAMPFV